MYKHNFNQIIIVPYDSNWPLLFEREKIPLEHALVEWNITVEHIGSTAVPGLSAKPIIDILVGVNSLANVNVHFIEKLETIGYEYVPEYEQEIPERRYFRKKSPDGKRIANLHVAIKNSPFWDRHINFRDYLRNNPQAAQEYEYLKRTLAAEHTDTQEYARAKTDFIKSIEHKINAHLHSE